MHVAVKDGAALKEIIDRLENLLGRDESAGAADFQEKRSFPRKSFVAPGLVQVVKASGEIMAFPVEIRNISLKGMLLEFADKGHVFAGMLKQIEGLSVTFMIEASVVTLECLPRRIVLDDPVEVGVEVSGDGEGSPDIQRFLM